MKRRQFGAMFATATFSLGGVGSVAADDESTEPLQIEDVSMSIGGVTVTIGRATYKFEDGSIVYTVEDWTMEGKGRSLSIGRKRVVLQNADAETYSALRAALVKAYKSRSLSPLLDALATTDFNASSPLRVSLEAVEADDKLIADSVTARGTLGHVVPDGTRDLLKGGASMSHILALGASEWKQLTIQRGDSKVVANDVTMELDGTSLVVTSSGGRAHVSGRSFEFSGLKMTVLPPETIPAAHVEFASHVRQLAAKGHLTLSKILAAADDSGVTVANTFEALRNAQFTLSLDEVTENGETVVENFQTSGTLAELLAALKGKGMQRDDAKDDDEKDDDDDAKAETRRRIIEVSSTVDEQQDYSFRVTGDLEQADPEPDTGDAVDVITEVDGGFRVDGTVGTGIDRFVVSGELTRINVPDTVTIETVRIM